MNENENGGVKRNSISFDNVQNNSNNTTNDIFSTSVSGSSTVSEDVNDNLNSDNMSSLNVDNDVSSNNISSDKLDNSDVNNMVDSGINNSDSSNVADEPKGKKKGKKAGIVIAIIILIILGLVAGGFIYYKMILSKNVFELLVDNTFDYLKGNIVDSKTVSGDFSFKVKATSSDSSDSEVLDIMNKLDLSGNYAVDYENKVIDLDLNSNYDGKKLLDADIYMDDGNGYVYLDKVYDKYIKMPIDDYDSLFSSMDKQKDYKVILSSINKAIDDALLDDYFVKSKDTIDGKKVNKTTLKLNKDNYMAIKKSVINSLVNDNEFLKSVSSVSEEEVSDIKDALNDLLEEDDDFTDFDISIYTKGIKMDFVKLEISDGSDKLVITNNDSKYNFEYYEDNEVMYSGSVKLEEKDDKVNLVINFEDKLEKASMEITIDSSVKYDAKVEKKDVSNSADFDSMSNNDMLEIYTNIMKNDGFTELYEAISAGTSSYLDDDDYDYGTDSDYEIDDDYEDTIFG